MESAYLNTTVSARLTYMLSLTQRHSMTDAPDYFAEHDHGEGFFEIEEYELYYRRFGSGDDVLVGVHGGPGMPHDYLAPLVAHAGEDLTVYLYDQFGVGRSDRPAPGDFDRYTVEHYRDELEAVRQAIDPDGSFTLYGQSWGGMLAQEYAIEHGDHLDSLILANTLADTTTAFEIRGVERVQDDRRGRVLRTVAALEAA